jgi:hypothetical protein
MSLNAGQLLPESAEIQTLANAYLLGGLTE